MVKRRMAAAQAGAQPGPMTDILKRTFGMEQNVKKTGRLPTRGAAGISQDLIDSKRCCTSFMSPGCAAFSAARRSLASRNRPLSRQIQAARERAWDALLVRTGRGVSLTQYGTILQEQAVTILGDMSNALEQLQLAANPAGRSASRFGRHQWRTSCRTFCVATWQRFRRSA